MMRSHHNGFMCEEGSRWVWAFELCFKEDNLFTGSFLSLLRFLERLKGGVRT